jgi:hypothetical protein
MKKQTFFAAIVTLAALTTFSVADENHETIEKVMKEGMKGDASPLALVLDGKASDDDVKSLAALILTMKGTKAPVGEQADYDTKVTELIAAMEAVGGGDKGEAAINRLDKASNCKACHSSHKPKD